MHAAITYVRRPGLTVRSADRNDGSAYTLVAIGCPRTRGHNAVSTATEVPVGDTRETVGIGQKRARMRRLPHLYIEAFAPMTSTVGDWTVPPTENERR